jgi:hypothetical protein
MPLSGERLVIEETYPDAKELMSMGQEAQPEAEVDDDLADAQLINQFWSDRLRSDVLIFKTKAGRYDWGRKAGVHHFGMDLRTLGCSQAWGIEQESAAVHLLGTLIKHHPFKQYLLTGIFMETSPRSGLTYVFRKLRPTVVLTRAKTRGVLFRKHDDISILCTLCMHPIAYYAGTWAGAMTPTDDVIAHLMLMRADEPMLWRRANQHPAWRPESGL